MCKGNDQDGVQSLLSLDSILTMIVSLDWCVAWKGLKVNEIEMSQ